MEHSLTETLRGHARECRGLASQIISPVSARGHWLDLAQACDDAAKIIESNFATPAPELRGTAPLIVYFGNDGDRDEFQKLILEAKPNLRARPL